MNIAIVLLILVAIAAMFTACDIFQFEELNNLTVPHCEYQDEYFTAVNTEKDWADDMNVTVLENVSGACGKLPANELPVGNYYTPLGKPVKVSMAGSIDGSTYNEPSALMNEHLSLNQIVFAVLPIVIIVLLILGGLIYWKRGPNG